MRKILTPRFTYFFTDFETVLQSIFKRDVAFFLLSFDFGLTRAESKLSFVFSFPGYG